MNSKNLLGLKGAIHLGPKKPRLLASGDKTTQRTYDGYGNLVKERLATGLTFTNQYDAFGRRTKLTLPDQSAIDYAYKVEDLFSVTRKGHTYLYQERDLEGEITHITLPKTLGTITYSRDALSRIKEQTAPHYKACFPADAYDSMGNLCHYTYQDSLGEFNATFSYDSLNQLILENDHSYAYDSLGNRLQKDSSICTVNNLCQITSDGGKKYTYDANGNMLTDGENNYFYDSLDRLIQVTTKTHVISYTYDPFHRRLSKEVHEREAKMPIGLPFRYFYLWDGENEIGMAGINSIVELRILGEGLGAEIGAACFFELNGKSYIPIHDFRGALVTLIDQESGEAVETYRYTAFGEELTEKKFSPWRYASKRMDEETGLIFFGRRYYHPHLGRWITADPQGFEDGPNLYVYLHNRPLTSLDLYGLFDRENFWSRTFDFSGIVGWGLKFFGMGRSRNYTSFEDRFQSKSYNFDLSAYNRPDLPVGEIGRTNGMRNNAEDVREATLTLSEMAGGYNVHATHNETHGLDDLHETAMNVYRKIGTTPVKRIQERWDRYFDKNPEGAPLFEECHSQGTALVGCALSTYPKNRRDRIIVAAYAPAAYISPHLCKQVRHYVSEGDFVHKLDIMGKARCKDTIVVLPRHPDAKGWIDHSIHSPTFAAARKGEVERYLNILGLR